MMDIDSPNLPEYLFKKEFAVLRTNADVKKQLDNWNDNVPDIGLKLHSYQAFPPEWINPDNLNLRLFIEFNTGSGKTVTSLATALGFVKNTMESYSISTNPPEVFIIGFSRQVFIRELMRRPEFGYITEDEIAKEARLRSAANSGSMIDIGELHKFHSEIRKRFGKQSAHGGFLKFYGYKEFFNRLFQFTADGMKKLSKFVGIDILDKSSLTEDQLLIGIREKYITINLDLVDAVTNGFLICDEFHNAYNSISINNYGTAIRMVLMLHDRPDVMSKWIALSPERMEKYSNSAVRALFLSATPINNSPTEIVDLMNFLCRIGRIQEYYGDDTKIRLEKADFFDGRDLKRNAPKDISWLIRGLVSYLNDTNPLYFPTYEFSGTEIPIPKNLLSHRAKTYGGTKIPYFKFVRCKMSKLHQSTYNAVFSGTLPPDGQSLIDIVFPNPEDTRVGLFKTREIKHYIKSASNEWKSKHGIDVVRRNIGSNTMTDVIVGDFLLSENIGKYSTKYKTILDDIIENLRTDGGKIVINHQAVRISGVLLLEEMLRLNGIISDTEAVSDRTLCSKCGKAYSAHKNLDHDHIAARYIIMHADIDKHTRESSIEKYKHVNNLNGYMYRIMLGSQIINEMIDLSEVRDIKIATAPDDISTVIQIIGRAVRKNSHIRLPPEKRNVRVGIYVTTGDELSYEELRYYEKTMDYVVIQEIQKYMHSEAIDAPLNYYINKKSNAPLEHLDYELGSNWGNWKNIVKTGRRLTPKDLDVSTWERHRYNEIALVSYIIMRLFKEQSKVWKYGDLWEAVKNPPFDVYRDTELFDEDSFIVALDDIVNDKIEINVPDYKVVYVDEFYIMLPITQYLDNINGLGTNVLGLVGSPWIDVDSWNRRDKNETSVDLSITMQLQTASASYETLKYKFYKTYSASPIGDFPTSIEIYGIDFHIKLVQDAIKYCFNILVNPDMYFSELHEFYFKLLYFYDRFGMILYANNIPEAYAKYITTSKKKPKLNAYLISSYENTAGLSKPFNMNRLNDFLGKTKTGESLKAKPYQMKRIVDDEQWIKKPSRINKVESYMLPVGHFISSGDEPFPMIYTGVEWIKYTDVEVDYAIKENDIVIGYYEHNPYSIELRFKLRLPHHRIVQHDDTRMNERGSVCSTRKKGELIEIAESLGIELDDSIKTLCDSIKTELMRREIIERRKTTGRIRWFYFHFENKASQV